MGFGDLKIPTCLPVLSDYLVDKRYVEGYVPSQADVVFEVVSSPTPASLYHALHWYNHIKSSEREKASLPGVKKALGKYGPANREDTPGSGAAERKDDDDSDLLGSEEEEESEEAKRLGEECLAQYESKKAENLHLLPSLPSYSMGNLGWWRGNGQNERSESGAFKQTAWSGALPKPFQGGMEFKSFKYSV